MTRHAKLDQGDSMSLSTEAGVSASDGAAIDAAIVQQALDYATREGGEIGVQVAAYLDGKLVVDAWSGVEIGRAHV